MSSRGCEARGAPPFPHAYGPIAWLRGAAAWLLREEKSPLAAAQAAHPLTRKTCNALSGHGILPVVAHCLEASGVLRPGASPALAANLQADSARGMLQREALDAARAALGSAGILAAGVRASGQTALAYPDPALRRGRDLDILIEPGELDTARTALERVGFLRARPAPCHNFVRGNAWIDLAPGPAALVRITGYRGEEEAFPSLCADWADHTHAESFCRIRCLPVGTELHLAALHAYYKHGFQRLVWALDLLLLARRLSDDEHERLQGEADLAHTGWMVKRALRHAAHLAGEQPPLPVVPDGGGSRIAALLLDRLVAEEDSHGLRCVAALFCNRSPQFLGDLLRAAVRRIWREKGKAGQTGSVR